MISRRQFTCAALAAVHASLPVRGETPRSKGPILAVTTYSFRDLSLEKTIQAMQEIGFHLCEFWEGHSQPTKDAAESWEDYAQRMRKWRMVVPMDHFRQIREKFEKAGIALYALTHAPGKQDSDAEIDRAFQIARTLGVKCIFASSPVSMAKRLEPFAARHKIMVGMHNHSNLVAGEVARPEDLEECISGNPHIGINLDIGHFVAAGFDPIAFIVKHHDRILGLHIKDRKKNQGPNTPFGFGDTPIKQVLQLVKKNRYAIPALIEYEYEGADTVAEVRKCLEFMKAATS